MTRPLLTLCMIVKDEAHTIARTLRSAKPYVDRWCILDTGSTDATPDIVLGEMSDTPGTLIRGGFIDFATTRNRLLSLAAESSEPGTFLLLLDADDVLEGGEALRAFLEEPHCECEGFTCADDCPYPQWATRVRSQEAFHLTMRQGSCVWPSARVVRADAVERPRPTECTDVRNPDGGCPKCLWEPGWRYVGAVHEVLCHPDRPAPSITIPGVTIRHEPPAASVEKSRARWERDLALLWKDIDADPENARAWYYLGLTFMRLGRTNEAITAFGIRLKMSGYWQERYDSAYERARLCRQKGGELTLDFISGMLDAHAIDPRRAEPLVALAEHYLTRKPPGFGPAFTCALRAFDLAKRAPEDALFLHADVYEWRAASVLAWAAWYLGEYEIGEHAARLALQHGPAELREHHEKNLRFYEERRR